MAIVAALKKLLNSTDIADKVNELLEKAKTALSSLDDSDLMAANCSDITDNFLSSAFKRVPVSQRILSSIWNSLG